MNIYWFSSSDNSVHHAILAPDEGTARRILAEEEKDIDPTTFSFVGTNDKVNWGLGRHLAVVVCGMGVELSK